jgi:hypothetical protein
VPAIDTLGNADFGMIGSKCVADRMHHTVRSVLRELPSGTSRWRSSRVAALWTSTRHASLDRLPRSGERHPPLPASGDPWPRRLEVLGCGQLGISADGARQKIEWTGSRADLAGSYPQIAGSGRKAAVAEQQLDRPDIGA